MEMASIHHFRAENLVGDTFSRGFLEVQCSNACMRDKGGGNGCLSLMQARFSELCRTFLYGTPCQSQIVTAQFQDVPIDKIQVSCCK